MCVVSFIFFFFSIFFMFVVSFILFSLATSIVLLLCILFSVFPFSPFCSSYRGESGPWENFSVRRVRGNNPVCGSLNCVCTHSPLTVTGFLKIVYFSEL